MDHPMWGLGSKANSKAEESFCSPTVITTKDSGSRARCMEMAYFTK